MPEALPKKLADFYLEMKHKGMFKEVYQKMTDEEFLIATAERLEKSSRPRGKGWGYPDETDSSEA